MPPQISDDCGLKQSLKVEIIDLKQGKEGELVRSVAEGIFEGKKIKVSMGRRGGFGGGEIARRRGYLRWRQFSRRYSGC
jgi:hypothetical protein